MSRSSVAERIVHAWSVAKTRRLRRWLAQDPVGFNFFGHVSGNFGLGVAARNTLSSLKAVRHRLAITDVAPEDTSRMTVTTHSLPGSHAGNSGRYPVNLFHLNPSEALAFMWGSPAIASRDRVNLCVPFWELEDLPPNWVDFLAAMDLVLAPTEFIARAVTGALPETPVVNLPQAVPFRGLASRQDRSRWSIPANAVAFLTTFDFSSDPARKNPLGVVRAFQTAFPHRTDVRLILKTQPIVEEFSAAAESLRRRIADDDRIVLLEAGLSLIDLTSLNASVDVYVSLHRSEGLGLGMMEALSLGVPVIATAYSGPMDFLTPENAELIPFAYVPVEPGSLVYSNMAGVSRWAEPDLDSAALAMRRLADDPALRARLGERGREDMEVRRREATSGEAFATLIDRVRNDPGIWARHPARIRQFRSLAPPRIPPMGAVRHRIAVQLKSLVRRAP